MKARHAFVQVDYEGVDISKEVSKDLINFTYVDNASGYADDISLTLKDDKKTWVADWFPTKGDQITSVIRTINWKHNGDRERLPCGRFFVDEPEYMGRPSVLNIKAISSPLNSNFSNTDRSQVWRNISLRGIAGDITSRYGLSLQFIGENNPRYESIEQTEIADSAFLSELCEQEGLAMKVTDSNIVIFDEREFEQRASVSTIHGSDGKLLGYDFNTSLSNTAYAGCNVKYYDAKLGRTIEFLYAIRDISDNDKVYQLNAKVRSGEEAKRLAQRTLRRLNKKEYTATLNLVGNVELLGGTCVNLQGFGAFDGKYYIEKATHSIMDGYTTAIEARKVLEGY